MSVDQPANPAAPEVLAEVDVNGTVRLLVDGDKPFGQGAAGRVYPRAADGGPSDYEFEGSPDSTADLRIPSTEIDDDALHEASVWAAGGPAPAVVIAGADHLPEDVLRSLVRGSARAMAPDPPGADLDDVDDIAQGIKNPAIWILDDRIRSIEQTVREALADDHLTVADYSALRKYPERLAKVESLAVAVRNAKPSWESLRPRPTDLLATSRTPPMDMFVKWAADTEADARHAVARISNLVTTQQFAMGQRQRLEVERLQRTVTIVGAAVLVHGMVAAVFGANFDIPGQGTRHGFWGMLLLMAAGGLGSFAALRAVEQGRGASRSVRFFAALAVIFIVVAILLYSGA